MQLSYFSWPKFSSFTASEFDGAANHPVFGKSSEMLCGFSKGKNHKLVLVVSSFVLFHLLGPQKVFGYVCKCLIGASVCFG